MNLELQICRSSLYFSCYISLTERTVFSHIILHVHCNNQIGSCAGHHCHLTARGSGSSKPGSGSKVKGLFCCSITSLEPVTRIYEKSVIFMVSGGLKKTYLSFEEGGWSSHVFIPEDPLFLFLYCCYFYVCCIIQGTILTYFPLLALVWQWGMCCILQLGANQQGLLKVR